MGPESTEENLEMFFSPFTWGLIRVSKESE
jgi:hypothetical protein